MANFMEESINKIYLCILNKNSTNIFPTIKNEHRLDLLAKPFSLNEAIAEELRGKQSLDTTSGSKSANIVTPQEPASPILLGKIKSRSTGVHNIRDTKISSLQYKRTFKIRTPLKPKRLKRQQKHYKNNKNKDTKRAINSNEIFNSKYIPLFKSLSVLFDNILSPDTRESYGIESDSFERNYRDAGKNRAQCSCTFTPNRSIKDIESQETTTTFLTSLPAPVAIDETDFPAETTTTSTHYTASSNLRSFERNKNLPVLLARNTTSSRRDHIGLRQRSRTTNHGNSKRHFSGDYGDNERYAGNAENATDTQYHEEHPNSAPRNYASSNESFRRISRNYERNPITRRTDQNQTRATEENSNEKLRRNINIFKGQNKLKTRGHKTESAILLPNVDPGLRRYNIESETKETSTAFTHENYEKSNFNVSLNSTSHKRFLSTDGSHTTENKKTRRADETITTKLPFLTSEPVKSKIPVVTIIDGYSIARDVNGENKLNEKTIHIHT